MCFSLAACSFSWDEQTSITSASVVYDEKADKYYQKLLQEKQVLATDWLNAGHVAWVQHKPDVAAERYGKAIAMYGNKSDFLDLFDKDRDILIRHGIHEEDIPLMADIAN